MNKTETIKKAKEALEAMHKQSLMPKGEYLTLRSNLNGEEAQAIAGCILMVWDKFQTMPKTYETENVEEKIAHLHYFIGSWDWYIIEKDSEPEQLQAFGLVKSECCPEGEMGYIDITEITKAGAELDLYFMGKSVRRLKF